MESKITDKQFFSFLKFVPYNFFDLWDSKRYTSQILKSSYPIVILNNYITEQNEKFRIFEKENEDFGILGVNNVEGIFDAYISKGKNINQPYKKMEIGWLAYNPYRVNVGSIGIKKECHKHNYISPAYVVFSCKQELMPEFLYLIFKSNYYNKIIRENTTGSVRQNLSFDILKKMEIPFPPVSEQKRIVDTYNQKIEAAKQLEKEAEEFENELEHFVFEKLNIMKTNKLESSNKICFTDFKNISVWGVERIKRGGNKSILYSNIYQNAKLSKYCYINPKTDLSSLDNHDEISFIPMEFVSDVYGEIIKLGKGSKIKSKGYTRFQNNDLIWAKITPCMQNGKSAIVNNLTNGYGYGSTEFYVIRKKDDNILLDYIYILLRTPSLRCDAVNYFTGSSGQQRVPKSYLEDLLIPIPPMEIQEMIVNHIYKKKEYIKELRAKAESIKINAKEEFEKEIFN